MRQPSPKVTLLSSNGELRRPALIRGHGHQRICIVVTSKNGSTPGSGWDHLFRTPTKILDGKDDFEDGFYELVLGAQVFALTKNRGEYKEITASIRKGVVPTTAKETPCSCQSDWSPMEDQVPTSVQGRQPSTVAVQWYSGSCILPSGATQFCFAGTYSVSVLFLTNNTIRGHTGHLRIQTTL